MEDVKNSLEKLIIKVSELEKLLPSKGNLISNRLNEIIDNLESDGKSFYRVSEDVWKKEIQIFLNSLNFDVSLEELYRQIKIPICVYGNIYSLACINDENFPIDFGKKMEELYYSDNFTVGVHGTTMSGADIENTIFKSGLLCNHGPKIDGTVNLKNEETLSFYRFMRYIYKPNSKEQVIIVVIPIDKKEEPMWKNENGNYYLTPSYLYGYYTSHDALIYEKKTSITINSNYGLPLTDDYNICDESFVNKIRASL